MVSHPHFSQWPVIVVCEHDQATLESICDHLTGDRFNVMPALTAVEALHLCRRNEPDLMLLDLALPDISGLDVLRQIRQADAAATGFDPRLPIIVLSGRVPAAERVRGLEEGADDFLSKPASYGELPARITAVLRRTKDQSGGPIRVGELVVDPARRVVLVGDREVQLTKKEFILLRMFAGDPTRVFGKDELLAAIWTQERPPGATRAVDAHTSRIRRKLGSGSQEYVVNRRGVGYSLLAAGSRMADR